MSDLLRLLVQVTVIIAAAHAVGILFRKIGQPQVVGEMAAGIVLGPTLLGWALPGLYESLFPANSLDHLNVLSQIGLLLFMFLVGLEFNPKFLRKQGHTAFLTSHASISAPYLMGAILAVLLYPRFSNEHVGFIEFTLFMGAAMSVTAFPVLARILRERNLSKTEIGAVAIACAAVDDVTAWCLLAYIVALVRAAHDAMPLWITFTGLTAYLLFMVFVVRKLLARLLTGSRRRKVPGDDVTAMILLLLFVSAMTTEWLGIHLLFGAFVFGAVMPKEERLISQLTLRIESVTHILLLPIFFAYTGLRTSIQALHGADMWFYCGLILLVAIAGKFGGSSIAARASGMPWRDSLAIGVLMNTRGLMELVILNIGLDLEIIPPALFAMMVVMALATTFMTTPLLDLFYPARAATTGRTALQEKFAYSET